VKAMTEQQEFDLIIKYNMLGYHNINDIPWDKDALYTRYAAMDDLTIYSVEFIKEYYDIIYLPRYLDELGDLAYSYRNYETENTPITRRKLAEIENIYEFLCEVCFENISMMPRNIILHLLNNCYVDPELLYKHREAVIDKVLNTVYHLNKFREIEPIEYQKLRDYIGYINNGDIYKNKIIRSYLNIKNLNKYFYINLDMFDFMGLEKTEGEKFHEFITFYSYNRRTKVQHDS
jgi:hypothetical protein